MIHYLRELFKKYLFSRNHYFLPLWAIIAIGGGGALAIGGLAIAIFFFTRKKKTNDKNLNQITPKKNKSEPDVPYARTREELEKHQQQQKNILPTKLTNNETQSQTVQKNNQVSKSEPREELEKHQQQQNVPVDKESSINENSSKGMFQIKLYYPTGKLMYDGQVIEAKDGNGAVIKVKTKDNTEKEIMVIRHGIGKQYYKNGSIWLDGEFKNDHFAHGIAYYPTGGKHFEGNFYESGRLKNGTIYYDNGNKDFEGILRDDGFIKEGRTYYYEDGTLESEGFYDEKGCIKDGKSYSKAGELEFIWKNGEKTLVKQNISVEKQKLSGDKNNNESGKVFFTKQYYDDAKKKIMYIGEAIQDNNTEEVLRHGKGTTYHENGQIMSQGSYENGFLKEGKFYGENGNWSEEGVYENGKLKDGKIYNQNGEATAIIKNFKVVKTYKEINDMQKNGDKNNNNKVFKTFYWPPEKGGKKMYFGETIYDERESDYIRHGNGILYYQNGQPMFNGVFDNNHAKDGVKYDENGKFVAFYKNFKVDKQKTEAYKKDNSEAAHIKITNNVSTGLPALNNPTGINA